MYISLEYMSRVRNQLQLKHAGRLRIYNMGCTHLSQQCCCCCMCSSMRYPKKRGYAKVIIIRGEEERCRPWSSTSVHVGMKGMILGV